MKKQEKMVGNFHFCGTTKSLKDETPIVGNVWLANDGSLYVYEGTSWEKLGTNEEPKRKKVYRPKYHNCPNCGAVVKQDSCDYCGTIGLFEWVEV